MVEKILNMFTIPIHRFFGSNCFKYYGDVREKLQTKASNPLRLWEKNMVSEHQRKTGNGHDYKDAETEIVEAPFGKFLKTCNRP